MFRYIKKDKLKLFTLVVASLVLVVGCSSGGSDESEEESAQGDYSPRDYIIGIEPGSGLYQATEEAIEAYGLTQEHTSGASSVMTQLLGDAVANEEPIVVTAWTPHWKFGVYDLKFLEDPKGVYGEPDNIITFAREGLKEDNPGAYEILDRFYWQPEDMQEVLMDINDGMDVNEAGRKWVDANQDIVASWTDGVPEGGGKTVSLAYTVWDSEYASTHVIKTVLEDMGYNVLMYAVEVGPMYAAVAYGSADATVCAWLPGSHKSYGEEYGPYMDNLGPNLEGAPIGLAVPTYMEDVNSIEDLIDY